MPPLLWDILLRAGYVYTIPRRPYVYFFRSTSTPTRLYHFHTQFIHPPSIHHLISHRSYLFTANHSSRPHFYYFSLFLIIFRSNHPQTPFVLSLHKYSKSASNHSPYRTQSQKFNKHYFTPHPCQFPHFPLIKPLIRRL